MRVEQQPAYLLHTKKISDSRLLVDCFTRDYGVIGAVARAPGKKKSPLLPFIPASISWLGKTELKTLTSFELFSGNAPQLQGKALFCGFYLNELTQRLLNKGDEQPSLYELYQLTLLKLALTDDVEPLLREYEFALLSASGYSIDLSSDALSGSRLIPSNYYHVVRHKGLVLSDERHGFLGLHLLKIAEHNYDSADCRMVAKRLTRILIQPLLGSRPLKSRDLFKAL